MFRLFPEQLDDLLDVASLPPTGKTELNYRTRPLSGEQEQRLTLLILFGVLPIVLILSVLFHIAKSSFPWYDLTLVVVCCVLVIWFTVRRITGSLMRRDVIATSLLCIGGIGGVIWNWMDRPNGLYKKTASWPARQRLKSPRKPKA